MGFLIITSSLIYKFISVYIGIIHGYEHSRWTSLSLWISQAPLQQPHLVLPVLSSNSSHVFDSLHMMIRPPQPASHLRSYGRYSLQGNDSLMANRSDIVGSRNTRPVEGYQGKIKLSWGTEAPRENSRHSRLLGDKDSLYLQMMEERGKGRSGRSNGFEMSNSSHLSENA